MKPCFKIPRSVLVVIYTADLQVLMLERAGWPGFWQSVTGSIEHEDEPLIQTAAREVREETGIDALQYRLEDWGIENRFKIFKRHRSRYAHDVTHNQEHVFGLELPGVLPVRLEPSEHLRCEWLPWKEAAGRTPSWTNRDAILLLPQKRAGRA
jgi:dihydroneopterin triphosphate diphosphatase